MKILINIYVFLLIQVVNLKANDLLNFQVHVQQGTLKGTERRSSGGRAFAAFEGIPYAEPPVGQKRFQPPSPTKSWNDVLDATKSCAFCPQRNVFRNDFAIFGSEDCLCLNVYTPQVPDRLLPVIVFIHGGGFVAGSGNPNMYGPDILLDHNLVVVTINYRIGALGFLSFEDEVLPGNNGLKDQSLAIKWVAENIKEFGGDPNKITIFGNSAGGVSVYYHLLSPLSKGLLHGAISSSGIATATWGLAQKGEAKRNAQRLAKYLNCPPSSGDITLECLQKISAYDIVRENDKFMEFSYDPGIAHKPVIEPKLPGAFITKHPLDIITSGEFAQIPYINGITTDDGALKSPTIYNNNSLVERLNKEFDHVAPMVLHYDHHPSSKKISAKIKEFYFQNRDIDNTTKAEVTDVITDALFYYPQRVTSQLHAKYSKQPIYFYLFGYRGSVSYSTIFGDPKHNYGVCHVDDLIYSMSTSAFRDYKPTEADKHMTKFMSTLWYNFANTGNPTPEDTDITTTKWEPVEYNKFKYLSIKRDSTVEMEQQLYEERFRFWEKLDIHFEFNKNHRKDEL